LLRKPTHGYDLLVRLEKHDITMDTDTLYPLLRRLESQGLLNGEWDHTTARPRKIYALTQKGHELSSEMKTKFLTHYGNIKEIIHHD
jgi:DNA-binding PadR family transcriptional regulator